MSESQQLNNPGDILKAARQELGMSTQQAADKLHLRASVVEALEQEDYSQFSSDVFLKGYFRSYCRLVNLHETRMVDLLDEQLQHRASEVAEDEARHSGASSEKNTVRFVVIAALLAIAAVFGWKMVAGSADSGGPQTLAPTTEQSSQPSANPVDPSVEEVTEDPSIDSSSARSTLDSDSEDSMASSATTIEERADEQVAERLENDESQMGEPQLAQEEVASLLTGQEGGDLAQPDETRPQNDADVKNEFTEENANSGLAPVVLKLAFTGDCWVTIKTRDDEARTLKANLYRAGNEFDLTIKQPVDIVLGDAKQVSITANNTLVDAAPYTARNGRASFVFDPAEYQ